MCHGLCRQRAWTLASRICSSYLLCALCADTASVLVLLPLPLMPLLAQRSRVAFGTRTAQHRRAVALATVEARVTLAVVCQLLRRRCLVSARSVRFRVGPLRPSAPHASSIGELAREDGTEQQKSQKLHGKWPVQYLPAPAFPFASCCDVRPPAASAAALPRSFRLLPEDGPLLYEERSGTEESAAHTPVRNPRQAAIFVDHNRAESIQLHWIPIHGNHPHTRAILRAGVGVCRCAHIRQLQQLLRGCVFLRGR